MTPTGLPEQQPGQADFAAALSYAPGNVGCTLPIAMDGIRGAFLLQTKKQLLISFGSCAPFPLIP